MMAVVIHKASTAYVLQQRVFETILLSRGHFMQFSIVIPVHNEEKNITPLLVEILQEVSDTHDYQIIYVDDCSSDQTNTILSECKAKYWNLEVVRLQRRHGQSTALCVGVQSAQYPLIVTLDGDGQNDPGDIEKFIEYFSKYENQGKSLLVNGYRVNRQDSYWRRFSSRIANAVRRAVLNDSTPDSGCGIKAFSKDLFLRLPAFDHMHRFLPALVLQAGGQVISLPVNHRERSFGRSKYGTWGRLWAGGIDLLGVMWLGRRAICTQIDKKQIIDK